MMEKAYMRAGGKGAIGMVRAGVFFEKGGNEHILVGGFRA